MGAPVGCFRVQAQASSGWNRNPVQRYSKKIQNGFLLWKWRVTQIFGLLFLPSSVAMYTLVNRDAGSSVYNFVKELLLKGSSENRKWTEAHQDYQRFNLMFGERKRNGVDYTRMGTLAFQDFLSLEMNCQKGISLLANGKFIFRSLGHISGLCQAVNYYRGSEKLLCKKVPLVT